MERSPSLRASFFNNDFVVSGSSPVDTKYTKMFEGEDRRIRFRRELYFLRYCSQRQIHCVPSLIRVCPKLCQLTVSSVGSSNPICPDLFFSKLRVFIDSLNRPSAYSKRYKFSAKGAIGSFVSLSNEINSRICRISEVINTKGFDNSLTEKNLHKLLNRWCILSSALGSNKNFGAVFFETAISPSDVGFHNAIFNDGEIFFIDFEYAGKCTKGKLVLDLLTQPHLIEHRESCLKYFSDYISMDEDSFKFILKCFEIRWGLIVLGAFFKNGQFCRYEKVFNEYCGKIDG